MASLLLELRPASVLEALLVSSTPSSPVVVVLGWDDVSIVLVGTDEAVVPSPDPGVPISVGVSGPSTLVDPVGRPVASAAVAVMLTVEVLQAADSSVARMVRLKV